jgi:eukaryotic-like serine/threonine-protein kinase
MQTAAVRKCARCGSVLDPAFRFCPGCSLPTSGDDVLSTEIGAKRHEAERRMRRPPASRALIGVGVGAMVTVVGGLGVLVFRPGTVERFLGPDEPEPRHVETPKPWEPAWELVPEGSFPKGPPRDEDPVLETIDEPFHMARYEVPNHLWEEFLVARAARLTELGIEHSALPGRPGGWETPPGGRPRPEPGQENRPVRNVSALAVAHFCDWLTERLGGGGWEIRPPTALEWEYAARGREGRVYPWGNQLYPDRAAPTGTVQLPPRKNIQSAGPSDVQDVDDDTSPFGIVAMGSNVEEFAISAAPIDDERLADLVADRHVIVMRCGASFNTSASAAEFVARTWATDRYIESGLTLHTVGIRLVKARRRRSAK